MPPDLPVLPDLLVAPLEPAEPQPADVFRLVDLLAQQPDLEHMVLSLATDMLVRVDHVAVRDGLNARWREDGDHTTNRVVTELMDRIRLLLHPHEIDEPEPGDVLQLVDLLGRLPHLERNVLQAANVMIPMVLDLPDLRSSLEDRWRDDGDLVTNRVIANLVNAIAGVYQEAAEDSDDEMADHEAEALRADLESQTQPLSHEMLAWVPNNSFAGTVDAFDEEANAKVFARMLARLRCEQRDVSSSAGAQRLTVQVSSVMKAIADDEDLRRQVFSIAETALGSCADNLVEGFSKVLLAVSSHEVVAAVKSGKMDAKGLDRWAGQMFRLSLLETAVSRFIADHLKRPDLPAERRRVLKNDPLETMVHAKVALRQRLDLPDETVSDMKFDRMSALMQGNLFQLECEVKAQVADREAHVRFRLGNSVWRDAMKALHAQEFASLQKERDDDPFFDLDLPEGLEEQARYAELAREVEAKWQHREDELLRRLADADR
ncbi:MAG TPA: NEL-type E3 ubiquitin ligase domain-containing protein [Burkholderiaceae bacterium]|nr:NEL-type E3 ubiquitin ligase domain-containing protein [Burkholderiaceae bacterium]